MDVLNGIFAVALLSLFSAASYHTVKAFSAKGKTLEEYKNNYPNCIGFNRINCYNCSHHQIVLKRIGYNLVSILNSHVCQHCGTELYRTKTQL